MNHVSKHILAATLLALGLAAGAQTATSPVPATPGTGHHMDGHHRGMMHRHHGRYDPAKMQERRAARQAAFKQKLQITPAQEGAWTAYVTAMQPPANLQRPNRAELKKLTTPERIDRIRALRNARTAEMDKRADAIKAFYAALTPEQQKVFDAQSMRGRRGGHHGGMHHRS